MKPASLFLIAQSLIKAKFFRARVPLVISWALTYRCNLSCKYCGFWKKDSSDLSTKQIYRIIDEMQQAKMRHVSFTGGEPLIRDDIGAIINYAKSKGIHVNLNTNGILLIDKFEEIKNADSIQVSLDGDEVTNDGIRGKGVYKIVVNALSLLKKNNIKTKIQTVLSKYNLDCIDYMCHLSKKLQIQISFQPVISRLFRCEYNSLYAPEREKYVRVIDNIIQRKREGYYIFNSLSGLKHLRYYPTDRNSVCTAGLLSCDIEPDGTIIACDRYPFYQETINILKKGSVGAFNILKPLSCRQCWCASQVELNHIASFNIEAILNLIKNIYL